MGPSLRWYVLSLASALGACGTLAPTGDVPRSTTMLGDATLRVSPNYSITVEKVVFGAAGAAILYYIYDPLAPNWDSREEMVQEDTYRLTLQMKRFHIGGEGEARLVLNRWAAALQTENGARGYQILDYSEGIDSSTPIARRYAVGTIRLQRPLPAGPAVSIDVEPFPVSVGESSAKPKEKKKDPVPSVPEKKPLPKPLAESEIDGALLRLRLNAQTLFPFDKSVLTDEGKALLDREVIGRQDEIGRVSVLMVSGHADRIGSYEYNQKLSEARAHAVRSYLVRRGFRAQNIRSAGFGERQPLAEVHCEDSLARDALIACLANNRRVEVRAE